jgi:hypothetical protein
MRRAPLVVAAAAAIAAVIAVLVAHDASAPAVAPAVSVAVRTAVDRPFVSFGDPVVARVVVALDRGLVRTKTLHVSSDLAPLTALSSPETTRTRSHGLETVSISQRVGCLTSPCLAARVELPPVRVTVTRRDGSAATVTAAWPRLQLRSRVTAGDLAASTPRFTADTSLGSPSYRIAPATATRTLDVVAALAAAGAAALLALEGLALARRRGRIAGGDELERALRLAREAENRPAADRRRALALLARLLHARDRTLERAATELAWSRPAPEPHAVDALVSDVERKRSG